MTEGEVMAMPSTVYLLALVVGFLMVTLVMQTFKKRTVGDGAAPAIPPEPAKKIRFTTATLAEFTGAAGKPVYVAVKDPFSDEVTVFDMTKGIDFYGPGSPYNVFAGKNASHGLALSSTDSEDVTKPLDKLSASEQDTLMQWYLKFASKYPKIGYVSDNETDATTEQIPEEKKPSAAEKKEQ
eukprot:CAMPEP_0185849142 /NCGR_PEP_ID=MMETSP1354-20130828/3751_1 /TAXON_ID=708628 /ORGANISM="Erythrolobus madagascarensis, Strain CCMP3276" /LENGTH=181 /DNA_ID=CAMNT_0028549623 /DNA_START=49 /DNA_END=594 /DNA_ORIENTATION=-